MSNNPLTGYFRQPVIYITLPSKGNFWPKDALDMPDSGELAVYPMTVVDDIAYRTPDALFNGESVVQVIQSCIPAIKNAWGIPSVDLNTILTGIRIASSGHNMDIDTKCPNCGEESTFTLDLRNVVSSFQSPDYSQSLSVGDLKVYFKPLHYKQITENSLVQFDEQKLMSVVESAEIAEEEKIKLVTEAFKKVSNLGVKAVQQAIYYIETPDSRVTEPQFISEFLANTDTKIFNAIKDKAVSLTQSTQLKPLSITCDKCNHEWQQPFTLDMSNFFG